jgi:hypothetical protein
LDRYWNAEVSRGRAGFGKKQWQDTKKAGWLLPARLLRLEASNVRSLQTLGATGNFEFNRLAFVQRFVPLGLNGGEVDENILAGLALDEPKSLAGIEPLHCSLFSHLFTHFILSYLCFSTASSRKAKVLPKLEISQPPLTNLKVLREQQTQPKTSMFFR